MMWREDEFYVVKMQSVWFLSFVMDVQCDTTYKYIFSRDRKKNTVYKKGV